MGAFRIEHQLNGKFEKSNPDLLQIVKSQGGGVSAQPMDKGLATHRSVDGVEDAQPMDIR